MSHKQQKDQSQCRIFKIPGELRNRIYHEVLLLPEDEDVEYSVDGHTRPGLLATCKEIRAEALSIYYYENSFHTTIHNYDSYAARKFPKVTKSMGLDFNKMKTKSSTIFDTPSWSNLVQWIRRVHAQEVGSYCPGPQKLSEYGEEDMEQHILGGMFETASGMQHLFWSAVEPLIMIWRDSLGILDDRWKD